MFLSRGSCLKCSGTNTLSLCSYGRAKQRYARGRDDEKLSPALHLASAAEAGALVSLTDAINISFLLCFFDLSLTGMMLSGLFMHKSYLACQNKVTASDTSSSNSTILRAFRFAICCTQKFSFHCFKCFILNVSFVNFRCL